MENIADQKVMKIRNAIVDDAAQIAQFLFMAMEEIIYEFIGTTDEEAAMDFLRHFTTKEENQYSWQNCFVGIINDEIVAVANVYDGASLEALRRPILEFIRKNHTSDFAPEPETGAGEMYLDCFAVAATNRRQGLGSEMLDFLRTTFVDKKNHRLGLLVEANNLTAKKFYEKVGFEYINHQTLMGKSMEHWQTGP